MNIIELLLFNRYPSLLKIYKATDGEYFVSLKAVQAYSITISDNNFTEIPRPSNLPPLPDDAIPVNTEWVEFPYLWQWKGDRPISSDSPLSTPSIINRMWVYRIVSAGDTLLTKELNWGSLSSQKMTVGVGDYIMCTGEKWEKLFDGNLATAKAIEANNSAILATTKATIATTKAGEAAVSAASAQAPVAASLVTIATLPQSILDFAGAKMLPSYATFTRASTASYVDVNGIIKYAKAGQPRFTHNPVTKESLGILIEEARTNYAINSNIFAISNLTSSTAKAPDGTNTALLISQTIGNTVGTVGMGLQYTSNGFYTRSMFVKPNNAVSANIIFEGVGFESGSGGNVNYNAITKTFSGYVSSLIDYGVDTYADGWSRVWLVIEKSATKLVGNNHYVQSYGGTATATHSMLLWGYQLEIGKCVTSYIPTSGSSVSRNLDALSIPVKYVPQLEGSFVLDGVSAGRTETTQNGYRRILNQNGFDLIGYIPSGGIISWDGTTTVSNGILTSSDKVALGYSLNLRKMSTNGLAVVSGLLSATILNNILTIGGNGSTNMLNGTIKRLTIYSRMLTDAELVKVTSNTISSNQSGGLPANSDLGQLAFLDATTILSARNRQELSIDGTGASITRNIRRPYDFCFSIVDSSGVTVTSQPAVDCLANTDNALIFTAPVGKTITYAIIPYFEY